MPTIKVPDRVLVVDAEPAVREAIETHLTHRGYEVLTASSGEEALGILARQKIGCMLADARLFGTRSGELLSRALERDANLAILVSSSSGTIDEAVHYLQYGAVDYVIKPLNPARLEAALQRALRRRAEVVRERSMLRLLKEEVVNLGAQLAREQANVKGLSVATLRALVTVIEARDPRFAGHSQRVARWPLPSQPKPGGPTRRSSRFARPLAARHRDDFRPRGIALEGRSPYSRRVRADEASRDRRLADSSPLPHLSGVSAFVRGHHERWDGKGYPDGLAGETIPWGARLIRAAEMYDALTTARPYREQLTPELAVERMRGLIGTVLAPQVHRALAAVVERAGKRWSS